jgi:hypothetical protein
VMGVWTVAGMVSTTDLHGCSPQEQYLLLFTHIECTLFVVVLD